MPSIIILVQTKFTHICIMQYSTIRQTIGHCKGLSAQQDMASRLVISLMASQDVQQACVEFLL